ncbi:MAG: hypothetical protein NC203_07830 [Firmicutes bacterium]|nr:hypothetical protein [[Eubacterium] siraeum]MCM1488258.1 hypothetical protein [Bacillota bacterium]
MPNYIANRLHLSGEQSRIDELLESIKGEETVIDFNRIVPMPESLDIEAGSRTNNGLKAYKDFVAVYTMDGTMERNLLNVSKESEDAFLKLRPDIDRDTWEIGKKAFQNEQKYGVPTGYDFHVQFWGSKWEAWDTFLSDDNTIEFYTAWTRVMPIVQKLAENYPDIKFEYSWADEDLGCNVGSAELENGQVVHDEFLKPQSKEAFELAFELWGDECLEEMGLVFNEKSGTYEWKDTSQSPQMS